jgi:hypothetical protein
MVPYGMEAYCFNPCLKLLVWINIYRVAIQRASASHGLSFYFPCQFGSIWLILQYVLRALCPSQPCVVNLMVLLFKINFSYNFLEFVRLIQLLHVTCLLLLYITCMESYNRMSQFFLPACPFYI